MTDGASRDGRSGLAEIAEDAVGFGGQELRLTRDLLLRPRAVIDAYDTNGPTAGGLYPRPLRYFLTVMGLFLLVTALLGGVERQLAGADAEALLAQLAAAAGKSVPEAVADFDQWYSLLMIPVTTIVFGGVSFFLIRRWSPAGDRQDFHQTFTFINAYSVLGAPLAVVGLLLPQMQTWGLFLSFALMAVTFARMGAGRWWRTPAGAWGRGALLLFVNLLGMIPATAVLIGLSVAAVRYLP